jgi:replicative DNA helicase
MSTMTESEPLARVVPRNLDAERSVLGASLVYPEALDTVVPLLRPEDFYREAHSHIFRALLGLHRNHVAVDVVTIQEHLATAGLLDEVGGPAYLASLTDGVPRGMHVEDHARIVRDKSTLRQLIVVSRGTIAQAYDAEEAAPDVVDAAQRRIAQVAERQVLSGGFVGMSATMGEVLATLETRRADTGQLTGVPSGFADLDMMTGGFQPGDLIILAARPSMGKTSLAQSLAVHAATAGKITVGLFSVEMSRLSLGLRLVASEAHVDTLRVRDGRIWDREWASISGAMARLGQSNLFIDDTADLTVFDIRAKSRRLKAEHGLGLLVIDYLQLMRGTDKAENKNLEVAGISRGLKLIARDLQVPVLVLSQLSRDPEKRADKRPVLADLRDSGALEQDADVVLFIHREEYYTPTDANHGVADVIVAKQRNGPTGTVRLRWIQALTRFEDRSTADDALNRSPFAGERL